MHLVPTATIALALALASAAAAQTCSTESTIVTFYGEPDNSPPGCDTAYSCLGRGYTAGGVGTYDDPLTFAASLSFFDECEVVYLPYLKKYLVMQDDCTEADSQDQPHMDIWTSPTGECSSGGKKQIKCEDDLTPDNQQVVRNPPSDLAVDSTDLWTGSVCNTGATYTGATYTC